jgi:aspartyl-tRNA(Asn)/glutamyl-tRNA(Gln) amidotransferase subunit C
MCPTSEFRAVSVTPEDVSKLCSTELADKLSEIVRMVGELQAQPTDGVVPMAHPLDQPQRLRADAITESDARDRYQENAPQVERGLYLVPKVIE